MSIYPYTQALLDSIPRVSGNNLARARPIKGKIPSPIHLPRGCLFHTRCPHAMPQCSEVFPEATGLDDDHVVYCHLYS